MRARTSVPVTSEAAPEAAPVSVRPPVSMRPPVIAVQPPDPEPVAPVSLRGAALPASPAVPDADEGRTVAMASNVAQAMIAATTQGRATTAVPEPEAPRRAPSSVPPGKQADFSGDLQKSPLPHVLLNVLSRRLSGSLVLDHEGQEHTLVFEAGVVAKVRSAALAPRLGDLLRERLGDERVEACARKALGRKVLLGKQLVIDGLMPAREVMQALAEQQAMRVVALCELPRSTLYGFFNQHDLLPEQVALESSPLALVLRCMREWNDQARMEESLQKLGARPLALHTHANLELFGFSREESAYLDWIFLQRLSYAAVRKASPEPFDGVRLLLYALAIARHLDLGPSQWPLGVPRLTEESVVSSMVSLTTGSVNTLAPPSITPAPSSVSSVSKVIPASSVAPSSPPSSRQPLSGAAPPSVRIPRNPIISDAPPAPPPSVPPSAPPSTPAPAIIERNSTPPPSQEEWSERRRQIAERAADLSGKNHYEVLQLTPDATGAEVQKAFLAAVKVFHPDRLPAALEDLRAESSRVFGAIVEAHKTLTDPAARASYDASLQAPGGGNSAAEQAEVERVLGASHAFQKAQILLRRNDVDQAERLAQEAVSLDPQPDHLALRGWIHALRNQLPEAIELLNRSIEESPQAEEALFYRGTVLKRMGHENKAISDFRRVLEQNPKHLEAAREVRLFEMRRQGAQGEDEGKPGLFGKLFQKKKS
jgi:curved DNA-binding protein CbpA